MSLSGFELASYLLLLAATVALAILMLGVVATAWHLRRSARSKADVLFPPISLLKPLKGLEDELEPNLESFFRLQYPAPFELIFCAADAADPALVLARSIASRYPDVRSTFIKTDEAFGLNPKVANLAGALPRAKYDLIHQSDANVRVAQNYLTEIAREFVEKDASMLTSLVVGVGEKTWGAAMENIQLSGFVSPAMCLALHVADVTCVCGKSMLFRRSELNDDFGGLDSVKDVLCEDFVLGERYKAAGRRVVLSPTTIENVNSTCGSERFLGRHSRWLKMRATLHRGAFIADFFSNPVALSLLAVVVSGFRWQVALIAAAILLLKLATDLAAIALVRGRLPLRFWWIAPFKDLLLLPLWMTAVFSRTVVWRGKRLRFGANTQLLPLEEDFPAKPALLKR